MSQQAVVSARDAHRLTADAVGWFTTERLNLLAAIGDACEAGYLTLADWIASSLGAYQHQEAHYEDAERIWTVIAAHATKSRDSALKAYALLRVGASLAQRGRSADAVSSFDSCLEESTRADCIETLALAFYWRAFSASEQWNFDDARRNAEQGVELAEQAGSQLALLLNLRMKATALAYEDADQALGIGEHALAVARTLGVPSYEMAALNTLAVVCTRVGLPQRAVDACTRQIALSRDLGDPRMEAMAKAVLGDAYRGLGQLHKATDSWLSAAPVLRAHHAHRHYATCLLRLGNIYQEVGKPLDALACLEESLPIFEQIRVPYLIEQARDALERLRNPGTRPAIVT